MNNTPQRYQEINLIDLIWYICSRWRTVIAVMLLFAVLGGVYQLQRNIANNRAAASQAENEKEEDDESNIYQDLTPAEISAVENAAVYASQLQMYLDYQKKSVYINIDPYNEKIHIINYVIQVNEEDLAEDGMDAGSLAGLLKQSYMTYISSGACAGELAKTFEDIDQTALGELVYAEDVNSVSDASSYQEGSFTTNGGTTTFRVESDDSTHRAYAMFRVRVLGSTAEDAKELADAVDRNLMSYTDRLTEKLDKHEIKQTDTISSVIIDHSLISSRLGLQGNLINSRNNLNNTLAAFTDDQKTAYERLTGNSVTTALTEEETPVEDESVITAVPLSSGLVKYVILGLIGGMMLAAVGIAMVYVLAPTLKTNEDITRCFQYYLMADFSCYQDIKKRFGAGIDRFLHRLRYRDQLTLEEQKELLAANMKVTCRKEGVTSVYLTSSCRLNETESGIVSWLVDALKKENITAAYGGSIERDARSYENMTETGAVVYVEKLGKSRFDSLENIDAMTQKQGVKILGVVAT